MSETQKQRRRFTWSISVVVHSLLLLLLALFFSADELERPRLAKEETVRKVVLLPRTPPPTPPEEPQLVPATKPAPPADNAGEEPLNAMRNEVLGNSGLPSLPGAPLGNVIGGDVVPRKTPTEEKPDGKISIFGPPSQPGTYYAFVFDKSESMGDQTSSGVTPFDACKRELLNALAKFKEDQKFCLIFYNHNIDLFPGATANHYAAPSELPQAKEYIRALKSSGATQSVAALKRAVELNPMPDVIFFLSDATEREGLNQRDIDDIATSVEGVPINTIEFGKRPEDPSRSSKLRDLAIATDGNYSYVNISQLE